MRLSSDGCDWIRRSDRLHSISSFTAVALSNEQTIGKKVTAKEDEKKNKKN